MALNYMKYTIAFIFFIVAYYWAYPQSKEQELFWIEKSIQIPIKYKWYNPNLTYIKIATREDKIYLVPGSKIIEIEPSFVSKSHDYFHLYHNGKEVPFYIITKGTTLSNSDTLIFIGSRAKGDTTWFDSYSTEEVFYLSYDESQKGLRYEAIQNNAINAERQNSVDCILHLEEHHKYCIGQPEFTSENLSNEGWVWELLAPNPSPDLKKSLSFEAYLFPSPDTDSVKFTFFGFNGKYDVNKTIHNLLVLINGDTAYQQITKPGNNIWMRFKYPSNKLFNGKNQIEVISLGTIDKETNTIVSPDIVGLQFCEIEYKQIPFAFKGNLHFSLDRQSNNTELMLTGFPNQSIIAIDTLNQQIYFPNSFPTVNIFANISSLNKTLQILLNDSIIESKDKGLHIVILDSVTRVPKYYFYPENSNQFVGILQNLPLNSIVIAGFNGSKIQADAVDIFKTIGSRKIEKLDDHSWIFATKIGSGNVFEERGNSGILKLFCGFTSSFSNYQSALLQLINNKSRYFIVNDLNSDALPIISKVNRTNYFSEQEQANVVVIAPPELLESAEKYIQYRQTTHPQLNFLLVSTDDVYKEFNFGKKSPHAIKRMMVWGYNMWKKSPPKFLVLWGDANYDTRNVLEGSINRDFVPAYGWPATDYWYSLLSGKDFIADIAVGRIPITSNQEGKDYIEKLNDYDAAPIDPWMKKFLFLSGGKPEEREYFYTMLQGYFSEYILAPSLFCPITQTIRKSDTVIGSEADASFIRSTINNGVAFMYFAGHASATVFDTDGWKVQTLNNKGKYGFFASFSCNTAAFAEPRIISRNEEYTIWKDKGFVGTLGSTYASYRLSSLTLGLNILETIIDTSIKTDNLVELVNIAKIQQAKSNEYEDIINTIHYNFLGDPLLSLKIRRKPDLYFIGNTVQITTESGKPTFDQMDSLFVIKGRIGNMGYDNKRTYVLRIVQYFNQTEKSFDKTIDNLCTDADFEFKIPIAGKVGLHKFKLILNATNTIDEYDYSNNILSFSVEVFASSFFVLDPQPNCNVNSEQPRFRFIDPYFNKESFTYIFKIFEKPDTSSNQIASASKENLVDSSLYIDWKLPNKIPEGHFWLFARRVNFQNNTQSEPIWVPFYLKSESIVLNTKASIKTGYELSRLSINSMDLDTANSTIKFAYYKFPYKIMSCAGRTLDSRGAEITVNNKVYFTTSTSSRIGFYIVVISPTDFQATYTNIFDTWGKDNPLEDSTSIKLVQYLRDSIPEGHYLFIASYSSSLRLPLKYKQLKPESIGSMDTLRKVIQEWGGLLVDSLGIDEKKWDNSYFFLGRKFGKKYRIAEGFDYDGDTVLSEGYIQQLPMESKITTPIFGPASRWNRSSFDLTYSSDSIRATIKVFGLSSPYEDANQPIIETTDKSIDLSKVNPVSYPFLRLELTILNPLESTNFEFKGLDLDYLPAPELAIKMNVINSDTFTMRGEEITTELNVYNLSLRVPSGIVTLETKQYSKTSQVIVATDTIKNISPDSSIRLDKTISSDKFDNLTELIFNIASKQFEKHLFNNSISQKITIYEDTEPPEIRLFIDRMEVHGGEYVSRQPKLLIEINDNSKLPYDSNSTILLINTKYFNLRKDAEFVSFGRNVPLKCTYSLTSYELEPGTNYFTIYTMDPSGNRDTLDVRIYLSRKAEFVEHIPCPIPFKSNVTIRTKYISPVDDATVTLEIYNIQGQRIRSINQSLRLNEDEIYWDGSDEDGNFVPQGIYLYKITVKSEIYSDPIFGKIIKVE